VTRIYSAAESCAGETKFGTEEEIIGIYKYLIIHTNTPTQIHMLCQTSNGAKITNRQFIDIFALQIFIKYQAIASFLHFSFTCLL